MADVRPFRALRPRDDLAARVISPPYDVLTPAEARALAADEASFVRVTRPETCMDEGTDPHGDAAYAAARDALDTLRSSGTMVLDDDATYYFYGQRMGDHTQVGLLGAASVAEYDDDRIKKHEFTRPDKEDDRTHHMQVLGAQVGLVFLAYRAHEGLAALTAEVTAADPAWHVTTEDGVEHTFWPAPADTVPAITQALSELEALYVADGHHRCAAASRVHAARGDEVSAHFLVGLFPDDRLQVLAYNRVVHDLNGLDPEAFLAKVSEAFEVSAGQPVPEVRGTYAMYLQGRWHTLTPRAGMVDTSDPVARLDASILQDHLLGPILGIDDPRRSTRIDFVGGIRGPEALTAAVDAGAAVAFHLFPTGLDQLFEVADAGRVMPPKSTWFEPKLREGVAVRLLD